MLECVKAILLSNDIAREFFLQVLQSLISPFDLAFRYETQAAALHLLGALRQILKEVHWHLHFAELRHLLRLCWGQVVLLEDGVLRI